MSGLRCTWWRMGIVLVFSLIVCIPASNEVVANNPCTGSKASISHEMHGLRQSNANILVPSITVLRLRGGGLKALDKQKRRTVSSTRMELDEEEEENVVKEKAQAARSAGLVLDRRERQEELGRSSGGTERERVFEDGIPKMHGHAKKVVTERPRRLKLEEQRDREEPVVITAGKISKRPAEAVVKRTRINCTLATEHGLFNVSDLAAFLKERIKVNGQVGVRQNAVKVQLDGNTIIVSSTHATQLKRKRVWSRKLSLADAFSSRYIKYLTRKFICKIELRDVLRCISTDFSLASRTKGAKGSAFELRYTNVWRNRHLRLKTAKTLGTRLEAARRELLNKPFEESDNNAIQLNRAEQMTLRKIKTTGERVGGPHHILKTRKTIGETKAEMKSLLKHWVEFQRTTYRQPWGGVLLNVTDKSVTRHDTDRVGKGTKSHSTAGYSGPRVVRAMTGSKEGLESMMYTGTAPNGFKNIRKKIRAQKQEHQWQIARYKAKKGFSVAGDADRTVYNWKPKHLFSGKMNLHKRDWR